MANRTNPSFREIFEDFDGEVYAGYERIMSSYMTVGDSSSVNPRKDTTKKKSRFRQAPNDGVSYQTDPYDSGITRKCPRPPHRCNACWKLHFGRCPYLDHFPRGATFNNNGFEIMCACGNMFIEDKWACTACGGHRAVIKAKYCHICNIRAQHSSYECQKDKVRAAQYKMVRDEMLSRVPIPYNPESLSSRVTYTPGMTCSSTYSSS